MLPNRRIQRQRRVFKLEGNFGTKLSVPKHLNTDTCAVTPVVCGSGLENVHKGSCRWTQGEKAKWNMGRRALESGVSF